MKGWHPDGCEGRRGSARRGGEAQTRRCERQGDPDPVHGEPGVDAFGNVAQGDGTLVERRVDRQSANQVRAILDGLGIRCFLTHDDIQVSEEWRHRIIEEIGRVDLFVPMISRRYAESAWCVQESVNRRANGGLTHSR